MPLFECEKCNCVENTAFGKYWARDVKECSECATGNWHGKFEKKLAIGYLRDQFGYLWTVEQVKAGLPKGTKIVETVAPHQEDLFNGKK